MKDVKSELGLVIQKKDFKCRKIHPVCGNPDPTKHSYVSIKMNYQKETLQILEAIGIFKDGVFNHP